MSESTKATIVLGVLAILTLFTAIASGKVLFFS